MDKIPTDDQIPDQTCEYCGYVGKPYEWEFVYECDDYVKKTRTVRSFCPKCKVIKS